MKRALCIGINDYPGTDSNLAGCVNDARDWARVFKGRGFDEIDMMVDAQATGSAILASVDRLADLSVKGDTLVIQYSGHGSYVPDENGDEPDGVDECLCPYDVMSKGPIVDDELHEIFSELRPGVKAVMISDSCHSGTISRFMPVVTPPAAKGLHSPQRTIRFMPPSVFMSKREMKLFSIWDIFRKPIVKEDRILLMAGCRDFEYSYDAYFNGRPNGAFSFVAIRAIERLRKKATYAQWMKEIRKILPSRQYPQSPSLFGRLDLNRGIIL